MNPEPVILHSGSVILYNADCLDILPTLEPGSVDAVVTDPPHGIGFKYNTHDDDPGKYEDFIHPRVKACQSLNAKNYWFWQSMKRASDWHLWFPVGYHIYAACRSLVQFRPVPIQPAWDPIIWWGIIEKEPDMKRRDFEVLYVTPWGPDWPRDGHPCARPIKQVLSVLDKATNPTDIVLDPFMGSGTTGVACVRTGRRFIGIEIDPGYFQIAVDRIKNTPSPLTIDGKKNLNAGEGKHSFF